MKDLPCKSDSRHGAVGDQRRARQIAGILQHADEQEQQQDLRQEHDHRRRRRPRRRPPAASEAAESGSTVPIQLPRPVRSAALRRSMSGARRHEDGLEHRRPPPAGRSAGPATDAGRPHPAGASMRRDGGTIARPCADARRPVAALRHVVQHRQFTGGHGLGHARPARNSNTSSMPSPARGADQRYRRAEFFARVCADPRRRRASADRRPC